MKLKDDNWYEEKLDSIRERKRSLRHIQEPSLVKKMKKDLKREQRAAKRAVRQEIERHIKEELS